MKLNNLLLKIVSFFDRAEIIPKQYIDDSFGKDLSMSNSNQEQVIILSSLYDNAHGGNISSEGDYSGSDYSGG